MQFTVENFIEHVHPKEGLICIMGIGGGTTKVDFYASVSDAIKKTNQYVREGIDAYYGCARFKDTRRTAANAKFFKSFWIDIDCGEDPNKPKPYATKKDGVMALVQFCGDVGLPKPTVIDSGNGLHCYWTLTSDITYNEWKPVADSLRNLCMEHKFNPDHGCTGDAARILRLPTSKNFKDKANPKKVEIVYIGEHIRYEVFKELIGHIDLVTGHQRGEIDATTRALCGWDKNIKSKFKHILEKSAAGKGCQQILKYATDQENVTEPQWWDILSTIAFCEDRDKAAPAVSSKHSQYDPHEMWDKIARTEYPHSCETYEQNNPGGCDGCPHKGILKNPINLGKYVPEAKPEDNIVTVTHTGLGAPVVNTIPQYPFPYFRPPHGGVYIKRLASEQDDNEDDDGMDKCIYKHDLYVDKRLRDPNFGEAVVLKHILPTDGLEEFTVPLADIISSDKAKKILAEHGVAVDPKAIAPIVTYIMRSAQMLQHTQKLEIARAQFGWHDDDTCFVIGNRQINSLDITYNPKCSATVDTYEHFTRKGTLDMWRKLADLYGKPTNAARAFVLGLGFGAPLIKFTNIEGFVIHIMNQESGQGKSTTQYMANSIYGHPKSSVKGPDDKVLARQHQMGILQHLPAIVDEITNLNAEELSALAFSASRGRGRDRMQASSNSLRQNNTTWKTCLITSGNTSIYDMLKAKNVFPEGELLRVFEFRMPRDETMSKSEADSWYGPVMENNYGLACEPYIQYILNNKQQCLDLFRNVQHKFDKEAKFTSKHRYYSVACACAITGLKIAKLAGCITFTTEHLEKWLLTEVTSVSSTHESEKATNESNLGTYIYSHIRNVLVINGQQTGELSAAPISLPTADLVMRYEPDVKKLYIDFNHLKRWCTDRRISSVQMKQEFRESGNVREVKIPLGQGMFGNMPAPIITCLEIDYQLETKYMINT